MCDCDHVEGSTSAVHVYWVVLSPHFVMRFIQKLGGQWHVCAESRHVKKARILGYLLPM